jgi:hypothetical protein
MIADYVRDPSNPATVLPLPEQKPGRTQSRGKIARRILPVEPHRLCYTLAREYLFQEALAASAISNS